MLSPPLPDSPDSPLCRRPPQEVKTLCSLLLSWARLTSLYASSLPIPLLQVVETPCSGAGSTEQGLIRGHMFTRHTTHDTLMSPSLCTPAPVPKSPPYAQPGLSWEVHFHQQPQQRSHTGGSKKMAPCRVAKCDRQCEGPWESGACP